MAVILGLLKFLIILALVEQSFEAPSTIARSSIVNTQQNEPSSSNRVEFKLPVKITSMNDLVAWARSAMRSMASRIDITLESVDDPNETKHRENFTVSLEKQTVPSKEKKPSVKLESKRPVASSALVSTYASLLEPASSFESIPGIQNEVNQDALPQRNLNAYLPLFLDDAEIFRYRKEGLNNYYFESEEDKKQHRITKARGGQNEEKYSQSQPLSGIRANDDEKKNVKGNGASVQEKKLKPVISVPFEAIVTITRENVAEPTRTSVLETRDPPDDFPPYFEKNYPRRENPVIAETDKKIKDSSQKRQISTLGDLLRMLGFTKKLTNTTKPSKSQSNKPRSKKPADKFAPRPTFHIEDQPQRQRRNETSQRQEFDEEDEEEPEGSLGSITDLVPLVIPILEDISDPNTMTDLGELIEAALPLVQGLSDPNDPDAPDVLGMIGPILTKIIGGRDGTGSDVAAILAPALTLIAPLIGPILGPLVGPILSTISNPPEAEGSSLSSLIAAVLGPLTQPAGDGGMSPLAVLTAGVIAALSKELKPGLPGGLDVGAVVGSVLSGVIAGTSAGLSGSLSADKNQQQPYGPYGAGPLQAGSANTGTNAGFVVPAPQSNFQQHQQPIPVNIVEHNRIVHHTTRRPYSTLPQIIPPRPPPHHPHPQTYIQTQSTGPLQAGTTNGGNGGSSYLPYQTTNAVGANTVNPIGLIFNLIKDILGAGIQVGSSVINGVFGIIGSSSADAPQPAYGPPPPSGYGQAPR